MKKSYIIIIILTIFIITIIYWCVGNKNSSDNIAMVKGNLLMTDYNQNAIKGIKIYSLEEHSELGFIADGSKGLFLNETMILFKTIAVWGRMPFGDVHFLSPSCDRGIAILSRFSGLVMSDC